MKFTYEGDLIFYEQEGGYAAPDITINGNSVSLMAWENVENCITGGEHKKYTNDSYKVPGKWRVILERID